MNGASARKPAKPVYHYNLGTDLVTYAKYMSQILSKMVGQDISPEEVVHTFRNYGA